jgi:hypothetical protein
MLLVCSGKGFVRLTAPATKHLTIVWRTLQSHIPTYKRIILIRT